VTAKLIYSAISSLDGYTADTAGSFDWAAPDEEVHAFVNELERPIGTYLYGRAMYETMAVWAEPPAADQPAVIHDFAEIWQAADKVVYSTSLEEVTTPRTRLEPAFEPDAVRAMKDAAERDLTIGGPYLGSRAIEAGLVDEYQLFLAPVVVGGGRPSLPGGVRLDLELVDEHRFAGGFVFLRYATAA
jgi:dihydrofolate reductase